MTSKDSIIAKVFYNESGYGSVAATLAEAKKYDATITNKDVADWKARNTEKKTNLRGYNSFIVSKPFEEFQMDLAFFFDLNKEQKDSTYPGVLLMVDIFSKFTQVVTIKSKQIPDILMAIKECIGKWEENQKLCIVIMRAHLFPMTFKNISQKLI
jgi:hypothetical protein